MDKYNIKVLVNTLPGFEIGISILLDQQFQKLAEHDRKFHEKRAVAAMVSPIYVVLMVFGGLSQSMEQLLKKKEMKHLFAGPIDQAKR